MLESFKIGHVTKTDDGTGVTVILAEKGAVGGVSVRGSAPATRETDLLRTGNLVEKANAVVLSGGSAFGLEAACGVMEYLAEKNCGQPTAGGIIVPIVCGASLFDLDNKKFAYPDKKDGYDACVGAAIDNFAGGSIGAGTGATVGKPLGAMSAVKSGLGVAVCKIGDVEMCAVAAVNALGDVYDEKGNIIAGACIDGKFIDTMALVSNGAEFGTAATNTTLGCIMTNAKFTKEQINKLADIAHDGYAMAIRPVHTMADGDVIFALASGEKDADFMQISCLAPTLMAQAIRNAVKC